jgi:preprotein translocase subunit SecF
MAENNNDSAASKKGFFPGICTAVRKDYLKNYKRNLSVVLVFGLLMLGFLVFNYFSTGELFKRDISLKGGVSITISRTDLSSSSVETALRNEYPAADINVRMLTSVGSVTGVVIESSDLSSEQMMAALETGLSPYLLKKSDYTIESMGSALGEAFFKQTMVSVLIAFVLMALTVFLYFKIPIPSLFVVLCAFFDIVGTITVIVLSGLRVSSAGVSALLILIGYSVTTDVLLTARVVKGKLSTIDENVLNALRTGINMTLTTVVSLLAGFIIAESDVIKQIMLIIMIGLCFDMLFTWVMNVGILRIYMERKEQKARAQR